MKPRKLILRNKQSPGDIVMLTAAVRDLKGVLGDAVAVDVRTPCPALWENNPHLTPLREDEAEVVDCHYPLIHRSNTGPWHFIHAFQHFLSERLGVRIEPSEFRGDIHLAPRETVWMSQVQEITREPLPFWLVVSGGKRDFTAKWWDPARWQAVVRHFAGQVLFVQVGEAGHHHPPLDGVIDLRGRTTLRQLVRLVYHAQGVLCPVTLLMHLAAAVPVRGRSAAYPRGMPRNRPCVVVAGGREPAQWEAYPHHQYLHTNGALRCCDNGGCWKSRVVPLGDGDKKDGSLCVDVVGREMRDARYGMQDGGERFTSHESPFTSAPLLPRCLDMITAEDVIRAVERYFEGGAVEYLTRRQAELVAAVTGRERPGIAGFRPRTGGNRYANGLHLACSLP